MRLWQFPYSTNVDRVLLALGHKGLTAEPVVIDPADRTPVRELSGQDLVPVLEDDGRVIADSMRIVAHLEERHPDPPLWPPEPARRAEIDVFVDWFNRVWKVPPNLIAAELVRPVPDSAAIAGWIAELKGSLDVFTALLDGRPYLMGEDFTAADVAAFPFLRYALGRDEADDDPFHRVLEEHLRPEPGHAPLVDWIERVDQRPRA